MRESIPDLDGGLWTFLLTEVVQLGVLIWAASMAYLMKVLNEKENAKRDRMDPDEVRAKYTDAELQALGDRSPFYRYVI